MKTLEWNSCFTLSLIFQLLSLFFPYIFSASRVFQLIKEYLSKLKIQYNNKNIHTCLQGKIFNLLRNIRHPQLPEIQEK